MFALQQRALALSSAEVLDRARVAALDMGYDPSEAYDPYFFTDGMQQAFLSLHGFLGDGTLAVISVGLLLRLATINFNLRALQRQCDRLELMQVYVGLAQANQEAMRRRQDNKEDDQGRDPARRAEAAMRAEADLLVLKGKHESFTRETGFTPMMGMSYQFGVLMPSFICTYAAFRGMMVHPDSFNAFVTQPTLWLDSMVLADPLGAMPILSACCVLMNAELNSPRPTEEDKKENALYMKLVVRGVCFAFVPITTMLPSCMVVFMATNAAYTALITWAYRRFYWTKPRIDPSWLVKAKSSKP